MWYRQYNYLQRPIPFLIVCSIGGNEESPLKKTFQNEEVCHKYETILGDNRSSDDPVPIYTELEFTQPPTPSNSTIHPNVQPTHEAVDVDINVDYVDPDINVYVDPDIGLNVVYVDAHEV